MELSNITWKANRISQQEVRQYGVYDQYGLRKLPPMDRETVNTDSKSCLHVFDFEEEDIYKSF